jgi:CO/xanthine dehydrogenase Mo-binding subunit
MAELSRRRFLQVSALAGGGLVLGFRFGSDTAHASAAEASGFAPNAWISIAPDGAVRLVCDRNEMGQDVYTSLTMLLAEELSVDPRTVSVAQAGVDPAYENKLLGAQVTGASSSIRDAWDPLRQAGATARSMLVAAAAAQWQVPASECRAEQGRVLHGDEQLAYGALASAAAKQPVPHDVPLKSPDRFTVIGKPLHRLDGPPKARGQTQYGIDVREPGMLYAALLPCPVLGGKVATLDASAARKRTGVREVVNIGEAVAIVADHYWTAKSALADLQVTWDEGPAATLDDAAIRAQLESALGEDGVVVKQAGDAAAALAKAESPLEARYSGQMLAHGALEPINCTARVGKDGVDVWASTQYPQGAQAIAAETAGVAPADVRIHAQLIGGGFGRRLDVDFVAQAVAIARAVPGVPVQLVWSREDDVRHDFYRPPSLHRVRGAVAGGKLVALEHKLASPSVTSRWAPSFVKDGLDPFMNEGTSNLTYAIPNLEFRTVIREVGIRVGYWRSVSNALNAFAIESFMDELAHAAGQDPVAFRLALLAGNPRQRAVIERVAQDAKWSAGVGKGRAFGFAAMECYDTHVALVAEISGSADAVRIERLRFAVDPGIAVHPDQVVAQLQSGAVTGLLGALRAKITIANGRVEQGNFDRFPLPRMTEVPPIDVSLVPSGARPGGMGEVGVPLVAPAIANAVFALTGKRIRSLPLADGGVSFA